MRAWLEELERRKGLDQLTTRARQVVLVGFTALLAMMIYRGFSVEADGNRFGPMIAFVLPLILFLPSILTRRPRGHAWLAFVSLLYFAQGVMVASLPGWVVAASWRLWWRWYCLPAVPPTPAFVRASYAKPEPVGVSPCVLVGRWRGATRRPGCALPKR